MARKATILVVDDEPHVVRLVKANLEPSGYKILTATDGEQALQVVQDESPDLVILDIMLPKMDGYEVCRRIREFSPVPVIMLTARSTEVDLVHGFDVGADDYVTKPFAANELLVRVRAVLRRSKWPEEVLSRHGFKAGPIEIDFAGHKVTVDGQPVKLSPTEYRLAGLPGLERRAGHPPPRAAARGVGARVWRRERVSARLCPLPAPEAGAGPGQPALPADAAGGGVCLLPAGGGQGLDNPPRSICVMGRVWYNRTHRGRLAQMARARR